MPQAKKRKATPQSDEEEITLHHRMETEPQIAATQSQIHAVAEEISAVEKALQNVKEDSWFAKDETAGKYTYLEIFSVRDRTVALRKEEAQLRDKELQLMHEEWQLRQLLLASYDKRFPDS